MSSDHFGSTLAFALWAAMGAGAVAGCDDEPEKKPEPKATAPAAPSVKAEPTVEIEQAKIAMFDPLPEVIESEQNPITDAKVALGRMLYYDPRLSKNHDVSCNSCHDLQKFGVDNQPVSLGHREQQGDRNSPTVYNAAGHFKQFWDGRAETVEDQAQAPILNPVEMAMPDESTVLSVLRSIPAYVEAFKKAFPDEDDAVTYDNLGKAVGAFERKLVTPSPWDAFLEGDKKALTDEQKKGFLTFVEVGCPECHLGTYVGGTMFQKLGREEPWPNQKDKGRRKVTKSASDDMLFKVPSLRNVQHTGPYFHDASAKNLGKAVTLMAKHQLGKDLSNDQRDSIVSWLKSLTGEIPKAYIDKPKLPESTPQTPKPDPN